MCNNYFKYFAKLEANLTLLKNFKIKFQYQKSIKHFKNTKTRYLIWQDVESCFKNRIKTGAIINLCIKDPIIFFNKAFRSFSVNVKKELEKSLLKVNVTFLANFIKTQTGETDIKHFQTKVV